MTLPTALINTSGAIAGEADGARTETTAVCDVDQPCSAGDANAGTSAWKVSLVVEDGVVNTRIRTSTR